MSARIGLCVDSSAQLPGVLADRARFDAVPMEVVPLTLHLDDGDYLDGVDLSAEHWYDSMAPRGVCAEVTAPSPGQFALAVEDLLARGCTEVLSLHSAATLCADPGIPACTGSVTAARLAAHRLGVPVRVLEVPAAGVGVGCCAWVAAEALLAGADLDTTVALVEAAAPRFRHVVLAAPVARLVCGSVDAGEPPFEVRTIARADDCGLPDVRTLAQVDTVLEAVNAMAADVVSPGQRVRVVIGHGDAAVGPVADALAAAVGETAVVEDVLRYRVGPSSSRLTGPGVVRCAIVPADAFPAR